MISPTPTSIVPSGSGLVVRTDFTERAKTSASQTRAGGRGHGGDGAIPNLRNLCIGESSVAGLQPEAEGEAAAAVGDSGTPVDVEGFEQHQQLARALADRRLDGGGGDL